MKNIIFSFLIVAILLFVSTAIGQDEERAIPRTEVVKCVDACPCAENTAFKGFVRIEGIDGESTDANHMKWIEIISASFEMAKPSERGSSMLSDFMVLKTLDKSSPLLMKSLQEGKKFKEIKIDLCKPGGGCYMQYILKDVFISEYKMSGPSCNEERPTEKVSFNFESMKVKYNLLDPSTGEPTGESVESEIQKRMRR